MKSGKTKIILILVAAVLVVGAGLAFAGFRIFSLREDTAKEESLSKKDKDGKKEKKASKDKDRKKKDFSNNFSDISSLCDNAPASNFLDLNYVVSSNGTVFFSNQYDSYKLYSISDNEVKPISSASDKNSTVGYYSIGNSTEDLTLVSNARVAAKYYYNDYIYYYNKIEKTDEPLAAAIYRVKADGSGEEVVFPFYTDIHYLSLYTLYEGKLYFSFQKNSADGTDIYRLDLDSLEAELLHNIPAGIGTDFPMVNVTKDGLYFKDKEGLKKLDPEGGSEELVIPDFAANVFTIYKGFVYYGKDIETDYSTPCVKRVLLDGSKDETIYETDDSLVDLVTPFILNDKLFLLSKTKGNRAVAHGSLFSCELDGSDLELLSDSVTRLGITDNAIYYSFDDDSMISDENPIGKVFETTRSHPIYKRDVDDKGEVSTEYVFLDPKPLNKGWVSCNSLASFYSPLNDNFYVKNYFYYDEDGELYKDGWKNIDGNDYYFAKDGRMYAQEFTPDGYFVGAQGTISPFTAPFEFIFSEYPYSGMTVSSNNYVDDADIDTIYNSDEITNVIDRGLVYEVTNSSIYATKSYSQEEAQALTEGQEFFIKELDLICTVAGNEGYKEEFGGECIGLTQSRFPGIEFKLVKREGRDRYSLLYKSLQSRVHNAMYTVYNGSVYITKDAAIDLYKYDAPGEAPVATTFADFYNSFRENAQSQGLNPDKFYFKADLVHYDTTTKTYSLSKLNMYN